MLYYPEKRETLAEHTEIKFYWFQAEAGKRALSFSVVAVGSARIKSP